MSRNLQEFHIGIMGPRGGPDDPCPAYNGGGAVNDLLTESDACNIKIKPFLRPSQPGTYTGTMTSSQPLKPGTLCHFFPADPCKGSPHYVVAGALPTNSMGGNLPGNAGIMSQIQQLSKNHPWYQFTQQVKEDNREGVHVRKTHSPKMVTYNTRNSNLPNTPIPQRNLPFLGGLNSCYTAVQSFMGVFSNFFSGMLPGKNMSAGNVLQMIKQNANNSNTLISANVSPEIMGMISALADVAGATDSNTTPGYITSQRANSTIYLHHAVNLFSQCKSPYDVLTTFDQLEQNPVYKGTNTLGGISFSANGASGSSSYTLSANGMVSSQISANANTQLQQAMQTVSSGGSFPGGIFGVPMFGDGAGTIMKMLDRIHPAAAAGRKGMMMSVVADSLRNIDAKIFHAGGDFLTKGLNLSQKIPALSTFAQFTQINFASFLPVNVSGLISKISSSGIPGISIGK